MTVVALQRGVADGMAVHAARALQNGPDELERSRGIVLRLRGRRGSRCGTVRARANRRGRERDAQLGNVHASLSGSERSRCFVMTCTAFATAAEIGATAGSPMPPIFAPLSSTVTVTSGMSGMRSTW